MMEEALITRLAGTIPVAAIAADRISWFGRVRGDGFPAVVLTKISPGRDWTHDGPDGLDGPRVQFDCYARDEVTTATLARAVLAELEASADVDGWRFHPAFLAGEQWFDEGEQDGGEPLFRASLDFIFYHEEI